MSTSSTLFEATVSGRINGVDFSLTGSGSQDNGLSRGVYDFSNVPPTTDPLIFVSFLLMGDPAVHRRMPGSVNPFREASYGYERVIRFPDGKELTVNAAHDKNDTARTRMQFSVTGDVVASELDSVQSVLEMWTPMAPAEIAGSIAMEWILAGGAGRLKAQIASLYRLPNGAPMPQTAHYLHQQLIAAKSGNHLEVIQDSVLWPSHPGKDD